MKRILQFIFSIIIISTLTSFKTIDPPGYKVGEVVKDFRLLNIDGNFVSLKDFKEAKGFVIVFTCNHCPYAVAYEDRIMNIHEDFEHLGYPVIAINPNDPAVQKEDSFEQMKIRAAEKGFKFHYLIDNGQKVFPEFGATKTPHVFILQKDRKGLEVKYIGAIDDNYEDPKKVKNEYVKMALDALINNREVQIKETKAIGCTIKVAKQK